jgi:hypothetical protein
MSGNADTVAVAEIKVRAATTRAYITRALDGVVEFRVNGAVAATMKVSDAEFGVMERLATEGAIRLYLQGASVADILDGKAIPDRSPPVGKKSTTREREPTQLIRAIAAVRGADLVKAARSSGERPTKEAVAALNAQALEWAKALSDDAAKRAGKLAAVQVELARLRGEAGSLEDLLAAPEASASEETETETEIEAALAAE